MLATHQIVTRPAREGLALHFAARRHGRRAAGGGDSARGGPARGGRVAERRGPTRITRGSANACSHHENAIFRYSRN